MIAMTLFRPLTDTQEKVARTIATGVSYKQAAVQLSLSPRTVEHYVHMIADLIDDGRFFDATPYRRVQMWAIQEYHME